MPTHYFYGTGVHLKRTEIITAFEEKGFHAKTHEMWSEMLVEVTIAQHEFKLRMDEKVGGKYFFNFHHHAWCVSEDNKELLAVSAIWQNIGMVTVVTEKRKNINQKPTLLDIARRAVIEDKDAGDPNGLMSTLQACWIAGAKFFGLTILPYAEKIPPQLTSYLIQPDRKLGDVIEHEGQQLVLIANMPSVPYAAFVPAEEIQL